HHDPVRHLESGGLGESGLWHGADGGHHLVRAQHAAVTQARTHEVGVVTFDRANEAAWVHHDATLGVVGVEVRGQVGREDAGVDPGLWEDHGDVVALVREGGCQSGAEESAADDQERPAAIGGFADGVVVLDVAQVANDPVAERKASGPRAGRDEKLAVAVYRSGGIDHGVLGGVDAHHAPALQQDEVEVFGVVEDRTFAFTGPERLAQGRPLVRADTFVGHHGDAGLLVVLADGSGGGKAGYAAANDEMIEDGHDSPGRG